MSTIIKNYMPEINELMEKGAGDTVNIELRDKEIVSLTINSFTLEMGVLCPPFCN